MKVLLVSSSGGHWVQLMRLKSAFKDAELIFASTDRSYAQHNQEHEFFHVADASRSNKFKLLLQGLAVFRLVFNERPDIVITTGASIGLWALVIGKWFDARTIWIDSIANSEEMSLSGKKAARYADLYLTQWEHLSGADTGAEYAGAVI